MGEDQERVNQLYPTIGTDDGGRSILRFTPVTKCNDDCAIAEDCPYQKVGRCGLERTYLNTISRNFVNSDPEKGIADMLNDFELQRIDHLMSLHHQRIRFLKVAYSVEHWIMTADKKGGIKVHPIFAEIRAVTKDIEVLMKALDLNGKWERKFGRLKGVGPGLGPSIEQLFEKGDPGYHDSISKKT